MNSIVTALKQMEAEAGKSGRWNLETLCKMAALEIEVKIKFIAELETENARLTAANDEQSASIAFITDAQARQALMIYAKDRQIAELTRMLFALGKQDGQTIRAQAAEIKRLRGVIISYQAGQQ